MPSPVTLYWKVIMNVEIVVLNCQKCKQCLNAHKSLRLFSKCHFHCHCICLWICLHNCLSISQVISLHHSNQMCQRSKVSWVALWRWSLNVFVFVIVFLLVRPCLLINLIKCLKDRFWKAAFRFLVLVMCLGNGVEQTDGPTDRLCKCKCNGGPDPVKYIRQCLDTEL